MDTKTSRAMVVLASSLIAGPMIGAAGCADVQEEDIFVEQNAALGDRLPGGSTNDTNFAAFKANFAAKEAIDDGLGPVFNAEGCAVCHDAGAVGGASATRIERRYGRFVNGLFDPLGNRGGSLRQLFTVGQFTGLNGQACNVPLEVEPVEATVHNVGRLTTPLFGLGLVDAMPDSFFTGMAAAEPVATRGIANIVATVLPNDRDAGQSIGGMRVGRFGWKAGVPNLLQFAADAYLNEMGISTQSCFKGVSVTAFATESAPNGIPQPAGCDDLAPPAPAGVPAGTDDSVGSCAGGITLIQKDIDNFKRFMTNLAPPPRDLSNSGAIARGTPLYDQIGCANCHTRRVFTTPSPAPNGVPSGINFQPFSDFLVHDMGTLGDMIGNAGDSVAVTRRMRTAPLWGVRFRPLLLHDGRCTNTDVACAIGAHDGQGLAARNAFNGLTAAQQSDVVNFVRSM
jgi:CxxC motif-containing protein (DUF1111 family)